MHNVRALCDGSTMKYAGALWLVLAFVVGCPENPGTPFDDVVSEESVHVLLDADESSHELSIRLDVMSDRAEQLRMSKMTLFGSVSGDAGAAVDIDILMEDVTLFQGKSVGLSGPDTKLAEFALERSLPQLIEICAMLTLSAGQGVDIFVSGVQYRWELQRETETEVAAHVELVDEACGDT
jgi:hypothetical protein